MCVDYAFAAKIKIYNRIQKDLSSFIQEFEWVDSTSYLLDNNVSVHFKFRMKEEAEFRRGYIRYDSVGDDDIISFD